MFEILQEYQKKKVKEYENKTNIFLPLVSVVILTYNHNDFISKCIEGALSQKTTFPVEIIVGEDESTDGTKEICIEYAKKFSEKIRLLLNSRENNIFINGNPSGRFNVLYGYSKARGKYIAVCEGDDYWTDPLKLQKQIAFLEGNLNYSGAFHLTRIKDCISKNNDRILGTEVSDSITAEDTIAPFSLFHTSSFVFRKDCLTIPDWYCSTVSGDMALFSIISKFGSLKKISEIMSVYLKHSSGITDSTSVKYNFYRDRINLITRLNEFHDFKYDAKAKNVISILNQSINKNEPDKISDLINRIKKYLTK